MILGTIFGAATVWASFIINVDAFTTCGIIILVFGIIDFVLYKVISTKGVKLFNDIEI